jgi:hypothetical protein
MTGGKREALMDERKRRIVAYHEGGYALVACDWTPSNSEWEPPALASIVPICCGGFQGRLIGGASTCMRTASASGQSKGMSSVTSPMDTNCRRTCWSGPMGCIR